MKGVIEKVEGLLIGEYRISILTTQKPQIPAEAGEPIEFTIGKEKRHRSLDANAYYWQLVTKLADVFRTSKPAMHNILLRRYGQYEMVDGKAVYIVIPDTPQAEKKILEDEYVHLKPTSQVKTGKDGQSYRTYMMLKGSHDYDTREMSVLIDGLVSECKEADIETIPPEELRRLMEKYARTHEKATVQQSDKGENSGT